MNWKFDHLGNYTLYLKENCLVYVWALVFLIGYILVNASPSKWDPLYCYALICDVFNNGFYKGGASQSLTATLLSDLWNLWRSWTILMLTEHS